MSLTINEITHEGQQYRVYVEDGAIRLIERRVKPRGRFAWIGVTLDQPVATALAGRIGAPLGVDVIEKNQ